MRLQVHFVANTFEKAPAFRCVESDQSAQKGPRPPIVPQNHHSTNRWQFWSNAAGGTKEFPVFFR
jgi:hypothetical protein